MSCDAFRAKIVKKRATQNAILYFIRRLVYSALAYVLMLMFCVLSRLMLMLVLMR